METSSIDLSLFPSRKKSTAAAHRRAERSPAALTGCVSKLSVIEQQQHAYFHALKDYAVGYAQAQAYLADDLSAYGKRQPADDYSLENSSAETGLLSDDGEPMKSASISDDDIDYCGYMGWLRH